MNKQVIIFYALSIVFIFSCSKSEPAEEIKVIACLNIENENIKVGETLSISNCSENGIKFTYWLNDEEVSFESLEKKIFNESGVYNLKLEVTGDRNNKRVISKNIIVQPIENSFYFPDYMNQEDYFSMTFDRNPINGKMYFIDGNNYSREFTYKEINENLEITSTLNFGKQTKYSYWPSAFTLFFEDGSQRIQIPHITATSIHRQEYLVSKDGTSTTNLLYSSEFDLNYIKLNENLFSVGGKSMLNENNKYVYHATINKLDSSGNITETFNFSIEGRDSLIGNIISISSGYMAYGGVFDVVRGDSYDFANYKSKLFFFNNQFELQNIVDLKEINEEPFTAAAPAFVAPYLIKKITNEKTILYGPDGLYIVDDKGIKLMSIYLTSYRPNSILVKDDYFIVSEFEYLKKYDLNGNLLAEIKHEGISTLGIMDYKENILFMAYKQRDFGDGSNTTAARQIFFGVVDNNLNIVPF